MLSAEVLVTAALMALVTAGARFLPFLFAGRLAAPGTRRLFAERFPPAVLAVLVVFVLRDAAGGPLAGQAAHAAGVAATVAAHLLRRNLLVSVGAGTAVFMLLDALLAPGPG